MTVDVLARVFAVPLSPPNNRHATRCWETGVRAGTWKTDCTCALVTYLHQVPERRAHEDNVGLKAAQLKNRQATPQCHTVNVSEPKHPRKLHQPHRDSQQMEGP